jgi:hypothetical protein
MPRQRVERALLVIQANALGAGALAAAGRDPGDCRRVVVENRLGRFQSQALRPPIAHLAQIVEGNAGVFLQHAAGGDLGVLGARGHSGARRCLDVLARQQFRAAIDCAPAPRRQLVMKF